MSNKEPLHTNLDAWPAAVECHVGLRRLGLKQNDHEKYPCTTPLLVLLFRFCAFFVVLFLLGVEGLGVMAGMFVLCSR